MAEKNRKDNPQEQEQDLSQILQAVSYTHLFRRCYRDR